MKEKNNEERRLIYQKYVQAIVFAMKKHEHQTRSDGSPFITHPLKVAESLREIAGCQDVDILSAALLHDTIEDTKTSYDEIAVLFGDRVAAWVAELTVDKRLPKGARSRQMLESAKKKSWESRLIKLADRYDNLSDMEGWSRDKAKQYAESTRELLKVHEGTNSIFEGMIAEKIEELTAK
jgi:guanosine-3',5'-bis(diphosphate) 3'-pyrophosphohydrolase